MSENTTNKNVRNDEIDLVDLFNRMGKTLRRWADSLGRAVLISVVFIMKRWLPLGLSIAAGIGVAYFMKSTANPIYSSDMVLRTNVIDNAQIISKINRLQTLDKETLSETLNIQQETINNLINIGAYWIIDLNKDQVPDHVDYNNTHNIYDTTNIRMKDRFDVRVSIKTPQDLDVIRDGIIRYLENEPQFIQRNSIRQAQTKEVIERVKRDIMNLDSLQKVKLFEESRKRSLQTGGQIIFIQEQNTQLLHNDIFNLYNRKQTLEIEMDMYSGIVTLLSDFSIPSSRVNGLNYYIKKIVPRFFLVMLIFLVLLANTGKIKEIYQKY